jgi:hypothetical protein
MEKLGSKAYRVQLPEDMNITNIFNVKHLYPFHGDNPSLRANFQEEGEPDAELDIPYESSVQLPQMIKQYKRRHKCSVALSNLEISIHQIFQV